WGRVAGDGVEGLTGSCACEVIAGLNHTWKVTPGVGSGVPGDRAGADGKVDVASCKYPFTVVRSGRRSRTTCRQVGDRSIVPGVGNWIVAPSFIRRSVTAARVNIVAQRHCHEAMVSKWIVCRHRPRICGDRVNLDVKIGADSAAGDPV